MESTTIDNWLRCSTSADILSARPADLLRSLKQMAFRTRLGNYRIPLEATLNGYGSMSAENVLLQLRKQFDAFVMNYDIPTQRRLKYFFQFQLTPFSTRQLMADYMGLMLMPGPTTAGFPPDTRFWDLHNMRFLTLSTRLNRCVRRENSKTFNIDHFDVRVLWSECDAEHNVKLGGSGLDTENNPYTRVDLSRMMDFEPGRDSWAIPRDCPEVIDQATELHAAVEYALAVDNGYQREPALPDIFLGFENPDSVDCELSPALELLTVKSIQDWMKSGKPTTKQYQWLEQICDRLDGINPDKLVGWPEVSLCLGDAAEYAQVSVWEMNQILHEDLTLIPAALFNLNSEQKPFEKATRIFCDLAPQLGRRSVWPNGRESIDTTLSKIQVIKLDRPEICPQGSQGYWTYDMSSTEPDMEKHFV